MHIHNYAILNNNEIICVLRILKFKEIKNKKGSNSYDIENEFVNIPLEKLNNSILI